MLVPVNGYCVIEPYKERETKSGLLLPENTKERPMRGTIIAATDKGWGAGTEVIYSKFGTIDLKYEGVDYVIVRERDIIAAIDDAV